MPEVFEQAALPPGRYRVGFDAAGQPVMRDLTPAEIRDYVAGTDAAVKAGLGLPLLLEHPPKDSPESLPLDSWDEKAQSLRNTVGRIVGAKVGPNGEAVPQFEVYDPEIAAGFRSGKYKFTSPQLQPRHVDGKGRVFNRLFSHLAVTNKPRNPHQGPVIPASAGRDEPLQFSMADYEGPLQMADDEDMPPKDDKAPEPEKKPDEPPPNPDLPNNKGSDKQKWEAICALMKELIGADLPAGTEPEEMCDLLLTALKTAKAIADKSAPEEEPAPDAGPVVEDRGGAPVQFSLEDVNAGCGGNKLLAKVCKAEHAQLLAKIDGMVAQGKISPSLKNRLLGYEGAVQFSDEGEFVGIVSLPQLIDALDKCLPPGLSGCVEQFALDEQKHPGGAKFLHGDTAEQSREEAVKMADDLEKKFPGIFGAKRS